jgi:hypothetical protein
MSTFNFPGANKFMDKMFRKADGVVWDLMTGQIGVQTSEGIVTLIGEGENARVNINMMDEFGVALPAFAQSTPIDQIKVGDIIYKGKRDSIFFVIGAIESKAKTATKTTKTATAVAEAPEIKKFRVMSLEGTEQVWTPPKATILGLDSGVMVLRSLMTMLPNGDKGLNQMQSMLMPMMMMSGGDLGGDLDSMMPLMLMSQMGGGDAGGMGNMMQMMFMMKMMGGSKGGSNPFQRG